VAQPPVARPRLTFRRLSGLDRSGPPPAQTLRGQPLHPWTIPNAIGFVRLGLIPAFVVVALADGDRRGAGRRAVALFAFIGWTDYLDGIAARVTGQYSRLGTLLDPLVDRLLIVSGAGVCWRLALLPRPALAVLAAREVGMLALVRLALGRGLDVKVNWLGRAGVWPVMSALFLGMAGRRRGATRSLGLGLALVLGSTAQYVRDGLRAERGQPSTST
jgi:phosphatidylglycerophosphate synthase